MIYSLFTEEQKDVLAAMEYEYDALINDCLKEQERLRPNEPAPPIPTSSDDMEAYQRLYNEYMESGSPEWKAEVQRQEDLENARIKDRRNMMKQMLDANFAALNGSKDSILSDAARQAKAWIQEQIADFRAMQKDGAVFSYFCLRVDGNELYLDPELSEKAIKYNLHRHYDYFADDEEGTKLLDTIVRSVIETSPDVQARGILFGVVNEGKKRYRTKARAIEEGAIEYVPDLLSIPTAKGFENALSLSVRGTGSAFIQPLSASTLENIRFENGVMYVEGYKEISEAEIKNFLTNEIPESMDLPLLMLYYSIILSQIEQKGHAFFRDGDIITVPIQTLAKAMGIGYKLNKTDAERIVKRTQSFHSLMGVIKGADGRSSPSVYPVLNFEGYNGEANTISFSSPYLNHLSRTVMGIARSAKLHHDVHMRRIKSSVAKAGKNEMAYKNVEIIASGITRAGKKVNPYRIKVSTLIEKNELLKNALERDPKHKTQTLKRVFTKTLEMLRDDTTIGEERGLPDPDDIRNIPTASSVNELVYEFPLK